MSKNETRIAVTITIVKLNINSNKRVDSHKILIFFLFCGSLPHSQFQSDWGNSRVMHGAVFNTHTSPAPSFEHFFHSFIAIYNVFSWRSTKCLHFWCSTYSIFHHRFTRELLHLMAVLFLVFFTSPILGLHKMPSSHREPCHRVHLLEQTIWKRMCVRAGAHLFVLFVYLCGARSKPLIHFYGVSFFSIFSSSEHIAKMQTLKCTNVFYFYLSSPWNLLFSSTNTLCQFNTELYMRANEWVLWKTTFFGEEIYSFCVYRGGFFLFILSGLNCLNNTIYLWKKNISKMLFPASRSTLKTFIVAVVVAVFPFLSFITHMICFHPILKYWIMSME